MIIVPDTCWTLEFHWTGPGCRTRHKDRTNHESWGWNQLELLQSPKVMCTLEPFYWCIASDTEDSDKWRLNWTNQWSDICFQFWMWGLSQCHPWRNYSLIAARKVKTSNVSIQLSLATWSGTLNLPCLNLRVRQAARPSKSLSYWLFRACVLKFLRDERSPSISSPASR